MQNITPEVYFPTNLVTQKTIWAKFLNFEKLFPVFLCFALPCFSYKVALPREISKLTYLQSEVSGLREFSN